jgi:hypothetical protein
LTGRRRRASKHSLWRPAMCARAITPLPFGAGSKAGEKLWIISDAS